MISGGWKGEKGTSVGPGRERILKKSIVSNISKAVKAPNSVWGGRVPKKGIGLSSQGQGRLANAVCWSFVLVANLNRDRRNRLSAAIGEHEAKETDRNKR